LEAQLEWPRKRNEEVATSTCCAAEKISCPCPEEWFHEKRTGMHVPFKIILSLQLFHMILFISFAAQGDNFKNEY
jgi:hypothetical protein